MNTVQKINLADLLGRSRNILLASIFVLTQLMVPLSLATQSAMAVHKDQGLLDHCADHNGHPNKVNNPSFPSVNTVTVDGVEVDVIVGEDGKSVSFETQDSQPVEVEYCIKAGPLASGSETGSLGTVTWLNHGENIPTISYVVVYGLVEGPQETASLIIEKQVTEGSDVVEDFTFNITGEDELDDSFDLAHGEDTEDDYHNIPVGTYTITENMNLLEGWKLPVITCDPETAIVDDITGSSVTVELEDGDDVTCTFTNEQEVDEPVQSFTILAHAVVCDNEALLPNWAGGIPGEMADNKPSTVNADTASVYASQTDGCEVVTDWDFQWGHYRGQNNKEEGVHKLSGDHVGEATEEAALLTGCFNCGPNTGTSNDKDDPNTWKNFKNNVDEPAEAIVTYTEGMGGVWVREVLKEGYVPFTLPPDDTLNNESAELYCHQDIAKYDNLDLVANPQPNETYHCVAFNAPIEDPVETGEILVNKRVRPADSFRYGLSNDELAMQFTWGIEGLDEQAVHDMGNSVEVSAEPDNEYTVFEDGPDNGYEFTGWYYTDDWSFFGPNCAIPYSTDWPTVSVEADETVEITLCNKLVEEPTGFIRVNKRVDPTGDNFFGLPNNEVAQQFSWGIEGQDESATHEMGDAVEVSAELGNEYTIFESDVEGFKLVGWYYKHQWPFKNCNNPYKTTAPEVSVINNLTTRITLCNQFVEPTTITVVKEANPQGEESFDFLIREMTGQVGFRPAVFNLNDETVDKTFLQGFDLTDDGESENYKTFDVKPGQYEITEFLPLGWELDNVVCDGREMSMNSSSVNVEVNRGDQIECVFSNSLTPLVLELDKENDTPNPTTVGEVVTYTLTLEIPEDSGVSYNTRVVDIAPENFLVNNASAQATLTNESPSRTTAFDYTGNPNYASPGVWELETIYPGEVVTMTYEATILEEVTPGTYPDIAYAQGGTVPAEERNETVYSNIHLATADEPFVGTAVTVQEGEVLGVQTLARTGSPISIFNAAVPILLITLAGALLRRETKGAL